VLCWISSIHLVDKLNTYPCTNQRKKNEPNQPRIDELKQEWKGEKQEYKTRKSQTQVMNLGGQKEDSGLHSHTNLKFDYKDE
jgi:hypothetical protein